MNKIEPRKASKLSDFDRKVLTVYADMSMETGAKIAAVATQSKGILQKSNLLRV